MLSSIILNLLPLLDQVKSHLVLSGSQYIGDISSFRPCFRKLLPNMPTMSRTLLEEYAHVECMR